MQLVTRYAKSYRMAVNRSAALDLDWKMRQELIKGNQMIQETSENVHVTKNDHVTRT